MTWGTVILLTNVWRANKDERTKLFMVISIQQGTVSTNCSLGLFVLILKFCLRLVSLSENRNLLFPFSSVFSLYAIQKMLSEHKKNAAVQWLLIKMRAYVDAKKPFLWRAFLCDCQPSLWTVRPPCNSQLKIYCALVTVLIIFPDLSRCKVVMLLFLALIC